MAYFPFFADIEGKKWLIAGGGEVACRKVRDLIPYGAVIQVVSPCLSQGLLDMEQSSVYGDALSVARRGFEDSDVEDADFVIAATSDTALNSHISSLCRMKQIPVNVVDVKEECSFIFPSIVRDDPVVVGISTGGMSPVVVGISTGGMSPVIARYLKARIREAIPEGLGALTARLGGYRAQVKALFPHSPAVRSAVFYELAQEGLEHGCCLTDTQAETIINRKREQEHE